jgi:hypothetical protein
VTAELVRGLEAELENARAAGIAGWLSALELRDENPSSAVAAEAVHAALDALHGPLAQLGSLSASRCAAMLREPACRITYALLMQASHAALLPSDALASAHDAWQEELSLAATGATALCEMPAIIELDAHENAEPLISALSAELFECAVAKAYDRTEAVVRSTRRAPTPPRAARTSAARPPLQPPMWWSRASRATLATRTRAQRVQPPTLPRACASTFGRRAQSTTRTARAARKARLPSSTRPTNC